MGQVSRPLLAPYVTAKNAIHGLTRAVAADLGGTGVTVNALASGYTATEFSQLAWCAAAAWIASPIQLPSPPAVVSALLDLAQDGELFDNVSVSFVRLPISMAAAALLALPLGFAMGLSERVNSYVDPLLEMLRPISGIAWIPLGLFIFGIGGTLTVFIVGYAAFFPLLLNTVHGVSQVGLLEYGEKPRHPGLWTMDASAYAPESLTGFVVSGAQLLLFTTGVGNPYVSALSPTIKLSANPDKRSRRPARLRREQRLFRFHLAVAGASRNGRFVDAIVAVEQDISHGVNLSRFLSRFAHLERSRSVLADHTRILLAIRRRRPEEARRVMRAHLENARLRMIEAQPALAHSA